MFTHVRYRSVAWLPSLLAFFFLAAPVAAQKEEVWTEIRSPNFIVVSNGGEKLGRRVADQFEQFRATFQQALPKARVDLGKPLIIFAAKNEKTLRALLPEFWERKGSVRPAGIFLSGDEKLYVALRTDAFGDTPYHVVYHEYIHALVDLNFESIPVWLNEGLAEFYANTVLGNKEVELGLWDSNVILLLRQKKFLPLDVLFAVDHNSPHYNEQDKASIFYAQSWALIHYFVFEDSGKETKRLVQYVEQIENRVEPVEAARRAFGDLKVLEKLLTRYVNQETLPFKKGKPPANVDEATFPMRALSPAESAALRGDLHVRTNRPQEARALLEEAIRLDPQNAQAHESMGLLHLRQNDLDGAFDWFDKAARYDSRSYIALYFSAMMAVQRGQASSDTSEIEARLLKVIELNPKFAPAHSTLANLYVLHGESFDKALQHARRASQLEPGVLGHRINLAGVLLRMDRVQEALIVARAAQASASSAQEQEMLASFIRNAEKYQESLSARAKWEAEQRSQQATVVQLEKEQPQPTDSGATPPPMKRRPSSSEKTGAPANAITGQIVSLPATPSAGVLAEGRAAAVTCGQSKALTITLDFGGLTIKLDADDYTNVPFSKKGGVLPAGFNPCTHLRGKQVAVAYSAKQGDSAGTIISVELQ